MEPGSFMSQWVLQLECLRDGYQEISVSNAPEEIPLSGGPLGKIIFNFLFNSKIKFFSKCFPPRNQGLPTILHRWGSNSNEDFIKIYWYIYILFTYYWIAYRTTTLKVEINLSLEWCFFFKSLKIISTTFSPPMSSLIHQL